MLKIPVGSIMAFAGDASDTAIHAHLLSVGWLPCWGQSVASATYPKLFSAISNLYGGDAANLSLPDLRGRFLRGSGSQPGGTAYAVGAKMAFLTAPPQTGTFALDSAGGHTHNVPDVPGWSNSSVHATGSDNAAWNDGNGLTSTAGKHSHTVATGGDSESRPVNVYVDYIIKVLDVAATDTR